VSRRMARWGRKRKAAEEEEGGAVPGAGVCLGLFGALAAWRQKSEGGGFCRHPREPMTMRHPSSSLPATQQNGNSSRLFSSQNKQTPPSVRILLQPGEMSMIPISFFFCVLFSFWNHKLMVLIPVATSIQRTSSQN
jgi:hypothetical protein